MTMTTDDVLNEFRGAGALLEGHFILSSGRRSSVFLQKALIFKNPQQIAQLCEALAQKIRETLDEGEPWLLTMETPPDPPPIANSTFAVNDVCSHSREISEEGGQFVPDLDAQPSKGHLQIGSHHVSAKRSCCKEPKF